MEPTGTAVDVGEGVPVHRNGDGPGEFGRNVEIQVLGICGDTFHGAPLAPELAAEHPHGGAVVFLDKGYVLGADILVAGRGHF